MAESRRPPCAPAHNGGMGARICGGVCSSSSSRLHLTCTGRSYGHSFLDRRGHDVHGSLDIPLCIQSAEDKRSKGVGAGDRERDRWPFGIEYSSTNTTDGPGNSALSASEPVTICLSRRRLQLGTNLTPFVDDCEDPCVVPRGDGGP